MRLHLFEFNDAAWAPEPLRDAVVETLGLLLRWGRMLRGQVEPLGRFLDAAGADEVLDLCAGAGEPVAILFDEMRAVGRAPPRFVLTDLYPRPAAWAQVRTAARAEHVAWSDAPVDATRIDPDVGRGRARVIINAFHHFRPATAQAILADAVTARAPIYIAEAQVRNPLRLISIAPAGLPAMLVSPLIARRHRLARILLTWVIPVMPLAGPWDAFVSCLRAYREDELRAMVADIDGYDWVFGTYGFFPFGKGSYFYGVPRG